MITFKALLFLEMKDYFLKKPLELNRILQNKKLDEIDLGHSISNNIELIIFTRKGENRYNTDFGCEIWDLDFELIVSEALWEERFRKSLLVSINDYEKRIENVEVTVQINEIEQFMPSKKVTEIKKKVLIYVEGLMKETREKYFFSTSLFLSPLSK